MRSVLPKVIVVACCVVLLGVLVGCREPEARQVVEEHRGQSISTAISQEPGCPIRIVSAIASMIDSTLTCRLVVKSVTKSPISSIEIRCAIKDTSGEFPRPVGPPLELAWTGSVAPADTVSSVLSATVRFGVDPNEIVDPTYLLAELEPQKVTFEGGREWTRTGPVAQ